MTELAEKIKPVAVSNWQTLVAFAASELKLTDLKAWDVPYVTEKLKQKQHSLYQEELKPYFETNHVINGLFQIARKLYGIDITGRKDQIDKWHQDVAFYEVYDRNKQLIAGFYVDLFARPKKRDGAWMDNCRVRHRNAAGELQLPIAFLVCNFSQRLKDKPSLLTHEEVQILFHEFGHCLHQMLTKIEIASIAGINAVAWDAIEFPSQFMENWCWHQQALNLITCHYEDKTPLPENLFARLKDSKNFQMGIQMLRQVIFALFDFRIHSEFVSENKIQATLDNIREQYEVVPVPKFHRFQHGFSHIFAAGYAAGFYSYQWAKVLACDAFSLFENSSIFDSALGEKFRNCILEKGASDDAAELFLQFQGRVPDIKALLKSSDIL